MTTETAQFQPWDVLGEVIGNPRPDRVPVAFVVNARLLASVPTGLGLFLLEAPEGMTIPTALGLHLARPDVHVVAATTSRELLASPSRLALAERKNPRLLCVVIGDEEGVDGSRATAHRARETWEIIRGAGLGFAEEVRSNLRGVHASAFERAFRHNGFAVVFLPAVRG